VTNTTPPTNWRTSSFTGGGSDCVEVAELPDGSFLVRNSKRPDAGTLAFTQSEMRAWVRGCAAGEFGLID
jgi:hypothetical protein